MWKVHIRVPIVSSACLFIFVVLATRLIDSSDGVQYQVDFGHDQTALVHMECTDHYAVYITVVTGCVPEESMASVPPQLLKNGAFDGRREIYSDRRARIGGYEEPVVCGDDVPRHLQVSVILLEARCERSSRAQLRRC